MPKKRSVSFLIIKHYYPFCYLLQLFYLYIYFFSSMLHDLKYADV